MKTNMIRKSILSVVVAICLIFSGVSATLRTANFKPVSVNAAKLEETNGQESNSESFIEYKLCIKRNQSIA